jgi:hypothetical protein
MPCTPAKARHLLKSGKARPKRTKLGLFYVQLCYRQDPDNQPLVVGLDPGSKFEGLSVVGTEETVVNLMVEAPSHVKDAVTTRRTMRRARRLRKWRRPRRFDNRLNRRQRIPPTTRSRWEAKARVVRHLLTILPLTDAVMNPRMNGGGLQHPHGTRVSSEVDQSKPCNRGSVREEIRYVGVRGPAPTATDAG